MANFCSQCGRPLQEGEVCTCRQAASNPEAVTTAAPDFTYQEAPQPNAGAYAYQEAPQPNAGEYAYQGAPQPNAGAYAYQGAPQPNPGVNPQNQAAAQMANQAVESGKKVLKDILGLFQNPVGTVKKVADENALMAPMIMVIANILTIFVLSCICMIAVRVKLGDYAQWVSLPYVRIVLVLTILSAIYDFALAGALLLSARVFFKDNITFAKTLSLVGCKVILDSIFILLGAFFAILSAAFGGIVIGVGMLFTSILFIMGFQKVSELSDTKKFYAFFVAYVMQTAVMALIYYMVASSVIGSVYNTISYYF